MNTENYPLVVYTFGILHKNLKKNIISHFMGMKSHTCVIRRLKGEKRRILSRKYLFCFLVTKSHRVSLDTEVKDSSQTRNTLLRLNKTFCSANYVGVGELFSKP